MTSTRSITVGILEDDEATRGYLEGELSREPDFQIVFSCGLLKDALAADVSQQLYHRAISVIGGASTRRRSMTWIS